MKTLFQFVIPMVIVFSFGSVNDEKDPPAQKEAMLLIKGGTFQMGDVFDDGVPYAKPVHVVTVSSFYLNKFEVTVDAFSAFVEDSGYVTSAEKGKKPTTKDGENRDPGEKLDYMKRLATRGAVLLKPASKETWGADASWRNPHFEQSPKDPVTCISWKDAVSYCNWLSRKKGLAVAYDTESGDLLDAQGKHTTDVTKVKGYRLPTEAEWEYAAREGGKKIRFGNGQDIARSSEMNIDASGRKTPCMEKGECRKRTVPVGSFKANALGLHDMSGNVWEWCSDYLCTYTGDTQTDPYQVKGMMQGPRRAARGGPWVGDARFARAAARIGWVAEDRCNNIGFRLARSK